MTALPIRGWTGVAVHTIIDLCQISVCKVIVFSGIDKILWRELSCFNIVGDNSDLLVIDFVPLVNRCPFSHILYSISRYSKLIIYSTFGFGSIRAVSPVAHSPRQRLGICGIAGNAP